MKNLAVIVCMIVFTASCTNKEEVPFLLPENAKALLAGDSIKIWKLARRFNNGTRMNMGDCFLAYRQSFEKAGDFTTQFGGRAECGEPMIGKWKLAKDPNDVSYLKLESDQIPEQMNIDGTFKLFRIDVLTDSLMVLRYNHAQFSDRQTLIKDYLVPEGAKVDDRTFHW